MVLPAVALVGRTNFSFFDLYSLRANVRENIVAEYSDHREESVHCPTTISNHRASLRDNNESFLVLILWL